MQELRDTFSPRVNRTAASAATRRSGVLQSGRSGHRRRASTTTRRSTFIRYFCCLTDRDCSSAPNPDIVAALGMRGLGIKEIEIPMAATAEDLRNIVQDHFPPLRDVGGFELLRSMPGNRTLIVLGPDVSGEYLLERIRSNVRIYVRPIQRDINVRRIDSTVRTIALIMHAVLGFLC